MDVENPLLAHEKLTSGPEDRGLYSYCSTLYRICQEENIQIQFLSHNWLKRLEKGKQIHYIIGHKFDLNPYGAGAIADDKYATYCALQYKGLPVVPHQILYNFANTEAYVQGRNSYDYVLDFFEHHQQHIVIKPNCGTGGRQVYQISYVEQLAPTLVELFANNATLSLCPFYGIRHEYRMILLDNEVRLAYMKTLPFEQPDTWKFNLQQGAIASPIPSDRYTEIAVLAKRAAHAIGLRFGSVDIVETYDNKFHILELNSGVMISEYLKQHPEDYQRVYQLYHDAVRKMFLS